MANPFDTQSRPSDLLAHVKSNAGTAAEAIAAAPGARQRYVVHSIMVSSDGAPVGSLTFQFKVGGVVEWEGMFPTEKFSPIHLKWDRGLEVEANQSVAVAIPNLGAGVTGAVQIWGKKVGL